MREMRLFVMHDRPALTDRLTRATYLTLHGGLVAGTGRMQVELPATAVHVDAVGPDDLAASIAECAKRSLSDGSAVLAVFFDHGAQAPDAAPAGTQLIATACVELLPTVPPPRVATKHTTPSRVMR